MAKKAETYLQNVRKRNGEVVPFDAARIENAIKKAAAAAGELSDSDIAAIMKDVLAALKEKFPAAGIATDAATPDIESIQDIVIRKLMDDHAYKTAESYIVYRHQRADIRNRKIDMVDVIDGYVGAADWRVKENANIGYSIGGLILRTTERAVAEYWLNLYPKEVAEAHESAAIHIHDLGWLTGYCAGWSLRELLYEGFNGVEGYLQCAPAKHMATAISHMVNFLGTLQNEFAGAQAFSSVDTYLAPYIRIDKLSYAEVKNMMQTLVFNCAVPCRWGTQTPFINFTFDWVCPEDLKKQKPMVGGKFVGFTYGDLQDEMDMLNRAFIEVMNEGDSHGRPFTFPIPTYNITKDFPWNHPNVKPLFDLAAKYGIPNFQNFLNSDLNPTDVRSMCCRLQLDVRELLKRGGGLFGSAEKTGSVGVVTINLPRLGITNKGDREGLFRELLRLLNLGRDSLEIKRSIVSKNLERGLYPFTKRYLGRWNNHFSTIGINGANEMVLNFTGGRDNIATPFGKKLALEVMDFIRDNLVRFQKETGNLYNLEATPAEGCSYRFAKTDVKNFPDVITAGTKDAPYYTNSTQLPVNYTDDPFVALEHQEDFQRKYTGGTMLHLYLGEPVSSGEAAKNIVRTVFENYKLPYMTLTPTFSTCPKHGYIPGRHEFCPICDAEMKLQQNQTKGEKK
ncbi:MAG: ribonucleoside triphosphate reductase [Rickettsiales bacterium]|jgi:ribonucleoside-triphosphate reductase|nr:ribonucleoside triphosphate reductase [Rickettsiales bacterium]